jgi:NAD(P)-dependent dehydrogenase (short-subunit alcohol dehydrogenase family)
VLSEFSLEGRVAVVTGGSRSIGRAVAKALAEAGADVAVGGRTPDDLERVAGEIEGLGRRGLAIDCDVDDAAAIDALVETTARELGRLDVLVANAGQFQNIRGDEIAPGDFDALITTNLRGVALACVAAGKKMIELGNGGSIVTISSIQGSIALPNTMSYVTSKHGVNGLTKALALDWAPFGIRVNAIAPGFIGQDDPWLEHDPYYLDLLARRTPLGRFGTGREIGLAAVFLASDASSYVTGAVLSVDGGWLAS